VQQPGELAAAFHKLCDPFLRTRLGEAGQQRVLRQFTLSAMCRETDKLYSRVQTATSAVRTPAAATAAV
jgi:hypothetical protein